MITLHHMAYSRSFRILWLLQELKRAYADFDYKIVKYDRQNGLAPKELLDIHPMGKAPIVIDDSLPVDEQVLAESAVIIEYLLATYDTDKKLSPKNSWDKSGRAYHFWLHFAEGSMMPPLVMNLILSKATQRTPFFFRPIVKRVKHSIGELILNGNIQKSLQLLENTLQNQHWLCGHYVTGADIQVYFAVAGARRGMDLSDYPNINNWLARCEARPSFAEAVAIGGEPL